MIKLGEIYIENLKDNKSRLIAPISIDEAPSQTIWFEVDNKYSQYLCNERSDAFIVGILNYAMRNNHDICFETPISEELYYNLEKELIDVLYKTGKSYYRTKLIGEVSFDKLPKGKAVATGISCGVDSFYTLSNHFEDSLESYRITHLTFNNVGSHGEGDHAEKLYKKRVQRSRSFAKEYKIPLIESNSNIHDVIFQNHYLTHTYTSVFAVLCMQKLYSKYYYSSGVEFKNITFKKSDIYDCTHYDYILLKMFSINGLIIYSEGLNSSRTDKLKAVKDFLPSYKYLNVCIPHDINCGKCEKCMRTLLGLEAVGGLGNYRAVFDIDQYQKNTKFNYAYLYKFKLKKKEDYLSIYPQLSDKIGFFHKAYGLYLFIKDFIRVKGISFVHILPVKLQIKIKKIYHKYYD